MFLKRINSDKRDQEKPRIWRAVIYLAEPVKKADGRYTGPSIAEQRALCRSEAIRLQAKVIGEFVDIRRYADLRPGLYQALKLAQEERLDYLIVSSLDRLANNQEDFFEAAWYLGHAGTVPMPAEVDGDSPRPQSDPA
jgi:hypothetical protein